MRYHLSALRPDRIPDEFCAPRRIVGKKQGNFHRRNKNILKIFFSNILNCLVVVHSSLHVPGARLCYVCFCFSRCYHYLSIYKLKLSDQGQVALKLRVSPSDLVFTF
jgi:hypothetical protein